MHARHATRTCLQHTRLPPLPFQHRPTNQRPQSEDQHVRYFHFRRHRAELNWQQINSINIDDLLGLNDPAALEPVLYNLTFGSILGEDLGELTPHHFRQLIPLAQCGLDILMHQTSTSGAALVRAGRGVVGKRGGGEGGERAAAAERGT